MRCAYWSSNAALAQCGPVGLIKDLPVKGAGCATQHATALRKMPLVPGPPYQRPAHHRFDRARNETLTQIKARPPRRA